jgi:hypothetical protein
MLFMPLHLISTMSALDDFKVAFADTFMWVRL